MRFYSILLFCLLPAMLNASGEASHPSIGFEFVSKDFGNVTQGEVIKQIFQFANRGKGLLEIIEIEKSWGCETALLSAKKIPSGKGGRIEVSVDTGNYSGALQKYINIRTNDPQNPVIALSIRAVVIPEIEASDNFIFLEGKGKRDAKEIAVAVTPGKSLKILGVRSTDPRVSAKLEPPPGSDALKYRLIVAQKADAKPGDHFGQIIIKSNSRYRPEITIYVRGTIPISAKWIRSAADSRIYMPALTNQFICKRTLFW
jgi:hypothetical protein